MRIICMLRGHHRSVKQATYDCVHGWRSVCRHCGVPMVRIEKGRWQLQSEADRTVKEAS